MRHVILDTVFRQVMKYDGVRYISVYTYKIYLINAFKTSQIKNAGMNMTMVFKGF